MWDMLCFYVHLHHASDIQLPIYNVGSGIFYRVSCPTESGGLRVGDHNSCSEAVGLWRQKVTL